MSDTASTIVVINGLAITAGSRFTLFAKIGRHAPASFATIIVTISERETTIEIATPALSISITFANATIAKVTPHKRETRNSFQSILKILPIRISPSDRLLIMVTDA